MKKILMGLSLIVASTSFAAEIIPETYLMERLLLPIEKAEVYVNDINGKEFKAIQVDGKTMQLLKTTENPFYVYDSTDEQKLVRKGDYFIAPTRLSTIYAVEKEDFETNYRTKYTPAKMLKEDSSN